MADVMPTVAWGCALCDVSGDGLLLVCTERCTDDTPGFTQAEHRAVLAAWNAWFTDGAIRHDEDCCRYVASLATDDDCPGAEAVRVEQIQVRAFAEGRAEEREACARLADDYGAHWFADLIRARNDTPPAVTVDCDCEDECGATFQVEFP